MTFTTDTRSHTRSHSRPIAIRPRPAEPLPPAAFVPRHRPDPFYANAGR